jgi:hypothetical protein
MHNTTYFPIDGFEAACTGDRAELRSNGMTAIWICFFESGVFTIREPGRGHAGVLPRDLGGNLRARVQFALAEFRRSSSARAA